METTFSRDGLTFDLHDDGPRDAPVVVLLHGFPGHHGTWADVAASLHAAGRRTLVPDQRGYSPGARPVRRGAYRIAELARDVLAMLDAVGEPGQRVHLVGHDWGGFVAWHLGAVAVTSSTKWRGSSEARWRSRCRGSKAMTALAVPRKQIPIGSGCVDVALGERESTWVDHLVDRE